MISWGRHDMVAMLPAVRGDAAPATNTGAAEKLLHGHGSVTVGKCKKKAPRKIHKAKREKHKRDLLNDLFGELGEMLGVGDAVPVGGDAEGHVQLRWEGTSIPLEELQA